MANGTETGAVKRTEPPATPTLDRMTELRDRHETIKDWMEWLGERGYRLGGFQYHRDRCPAHDLDQPDASCVCEEIQSECWGVNPGCPHQDHHVDWVLRFPMKDRGEPLDRLLGEYSDVDPAEADREHRALLEYIRELNGQ